MKTVLVVEDNAVIANIYRSKLAAAGFLTEIASDGAIALKLIEQSRFDLVLLDLMLPKISGLEVLKQLRVGARFRDVPVIVVSNTYVESLIQQAWDAGATDVLQKSKDSPKQVIDAVREVLSAGEAAAPVSGGHAPFVAAGETGASRDRTGRGESEPARRNDTMSTTEETVHPETGSSHSPDGCTPTAAASRSSTGPQLTEELGRALEHYCRAPQKLVNINELRRLLGGLSERGIWRADSVVARLASYSDELLKQLQVQSDYLNPSVVATLHDAIALLVSSSDIAVSRLDRASTPHLVLVAHRRLATRQAVAHALERSGMRAVLTGEPTTLTDVIGESRFDLAMVDLEIAGSAPAEFLSRLHSRPSAQHTPFVLVCSLADVERTRVVARAIDADWIAAPFLEPLVPLRVLASTLTAGLAASRYDTGSVR